MTLLCTPTTRPNHSCRDCRPWPGVAQRSAGYPGSDPQERFIPVGNASGDLASTRLLKTTVHRARTSPPGPRFGPHVTRHPAQVPRPGLCNPYRIEFCLGSVTRGSHVPWQPRAMVSKSFRLAPAPGSLPLGQAQFRLPLGRDERLPQKSPRPTFVDVTKHEPLLRIGLGRALSSGLAIQEEAHFILVHQDPP